MADIYNLLATWNNGATTFNGIAINVTDTASASASKLLDLAVGGTSKFGVRKDGLVNLASGTTLAGNGDGGAILANAAGTAKLTLDSSGNITFGGLIKQQVLQLGNNSGAAYTQINNADSGAFTISSGMAYSWRSSTSGMGGTNDTLLYRDAAGIIAQRNSTNAQAFRVYNTGDSSNGEWFGIDWKTDAGICTIKTTAAGTGSQKPLQIRMSESASTPTGVANTVILYTDDNGSGKTRLMAIFGSGAAQQIAIEP